MNSYKMGISILAAVIIVRAINLSNQKDLIKIQENNKVAIQRYVTDVQPGNENLVVILNNSAALNSKGEYTTFIDRIVVQEILKELKKENYSVITINLPCLTDLQCMDKFYEVNNLLTYLNPEAIVFQSPSSGWNTDALGKHFDQLNVPVYVYQTDSALNYNLYVGPDNIKLGKEAVLGIEKDVKPGQKILYIETVRLVNGNKLDNGYERINSAKKELESLGALEYKTIFTEWSKSRTYEEILTLLSKDSNVQYIIAPSVETAQGASLALIELGLENRVKIICLDITQESIDMLKAGTIEGVVGQELTKQGRFIANNITTVKNREKSKRKELFASSYFTKETIDQKKNADGTYNY